MTRWARGGPANKKKEHDATPWHKFKNIQQNDSKAKTEKKCKNTNSVETKLKHVIKDPKGKKKTHHSEESKAHTKVHLASNFQSEDEYKTKSSQANVSQSIADKLENMGTVKGMSIQSSSIRIKKNDLNTRKLKKKLKHSSKSAELLKTDLAENLMAIKKSEKLSDTDLKQLDTVIAKDQKREKRRLQRIDAKASEKTCFNCRKSGHTMADCTEGNTHERASGICFKCGSTEHSMTKCRVKLLEGHYPYARCFICGEQGHLSRQCPDNPRGLYPKGGCCKTCGSVEHYNKDCPELQQNEGIFNMTLTTINMTKRTSIDEEIYDHHKVQKLQTKKPKIVKF